jgi:hypothetical protein
MFDARREGFDPNRFKRSVKDWIKTHPEGTETELADFCEDQIPSAQYQAHQWLVEHTLSWYRHILAQRQGAADDDHEHEAS